LAVVQAHPQAPNGDNDLRRIFGSGCTPQATPLGPGIRLDAYEIVRPLGARKSLFRFWLAEGPRRAGERATLA